MPTAGDDVQAAVDGGGVVAAAAPTKMIAKNNSPSMDTLGVSVHHLEHIFLEEVYSFTTTAAANQNPLSRDSKIYQIEGLRGPPGVIRTRGTNTVCPIDGRLGAAYVNCLQGEDHVGEATQMLSYSWNYTIGDILDTLSDYCLRNNLNPKRTYIWICCLCVNQHRVVENSAQQQAGMANPAKVDFFAIFGDRVEKIGHLLAMMAPWSAPVYITRVWCIFEIFTAHRMGGCKVDIVMPPKENESLELEVLDNGEGINALYETLGNTKVENANASVESDRLAILGQVESDVGYSVLNNLVNDLLRGWMQGILTQLVETRENTNDEEYADFCNQIGSILKHNGEHSAAMNLHQTAQTICENVLGKNHEQTATAYSGIGCVLYELGDYEGALSKYEEALTAQLSALGKNHPHVAITHSNIGSVLYAVGDHEGALVKHKECLANLLPALGKIILRWQQPRTTLGWSWRRWVTIKVLWKATRKLFPFDCQHWARIILMWHHLHNIGSVLDEMGDLKVLWQSMRNALAIIVSWARIILCGNHTTLVLCWKRWVTVKVLGKDKKLFHYCQIGQESTSVATTYSNIGSYFPAWVTMKVLGKDEEALAIELYIGSVLEEMGDLKVPWQSTKIFH
ncbi:Kinesin light chain [Seminavis robusta]|uniref:Kinesin light chain n=1 Tax=Seminavis robusta TaxID=568900 RepID=A0A9N8DXP1_9STRA|nr:Kinesin light chain [Seminavis robusta]|eukprot:Sro455_g146560.1 Kinesin light chain (624) ;mRNA; r:51166-53037